MKITIIPLEKQARGQFNYGEILENKPIGFPQDGGALRPYSNLFYWAHAWTPGKASVIGEHPHQGFEIMSFVLKGSLEHYDSKNKDWRKLNEGDAQIIRSGSGITHAEKVNETSEFFQIWLDPNLDLTLDKEATYNDYSSSSFPVKNENGIKTKFYYGNNAPMEMVTEGVTIKEMWVQPGKHELKFNKNEIISIYLLRGNIKLNEQSLRPKDFAVIEEPDQVIADAEKESRLFIIQSPMQLNYLTYAERMRRHFV